MSDASHPHRQAIIGNTRITRRNLLALGASAAGGAVMDGAIRIVVADGHPLFRRGMVAMPAGAPGLAVIGEAGTGGEAVEATVATGADVVLMDLQMPEMGGIPAIRELRRVAPGAPILVVTLFEDDDSVFLALRAGAQGHGNQTIARHLSISAKTVANHLSTIFDKLRVADRGEAIVRAREAGFGAGEP